MNHATNSNGDERFLDSCIASARAASDGETIAQAAARFRQTLPRVEEPRARRFSPRFAAAAAVIAGLALTLNLFAPDGSGTAFADVQAWFSQFRTLDVQTSISLGADELVRVRARSNARGDTRIEQSGIVQILNVERSTFSTLLPGDRYFDQPIDLFQGGDDNLEWVEKLRMFKGEAVALPDMRVIDGQTVAGHRLLMDGVDLTLWSNIDNSQPVLLEGELPGGLSLETRFLFDAPLEAQLFDIPTGFERVAPE